MTLIVGEVCCNAGFLSFSYCLTFQIMACLISGSNNSTLGWARF